MKSFVDPGNRLSILQADENRGIVDFNEERDYHLVYVLTDAFGNQSTYSFTVKGRRQVIPAGKQHCAARLLKWGVPNSFQRPGVQLQVRQGLLPHDVELVPHASAGTKGLSDAWSFYDGSFPLLGWAELSLRVKSVPKDTTGICILGNDGREYDARLSDGWVTGRIRELGNTYEVGFRKKKH